MCISPFRFTLTLAPIFTGFSSSSESDADFRYSIVAMESVADDLIRCSRFDMLFVFQAIGEQANDIGEIKRLFLVERGELIAGALDNTTGDVIVDFQIR
ncbi:hypothetical protein L1987_63990 [Smallanthus sonchifolius]|uniref:Uncharacterized protein n=1 Tax=Smallanthus sonchifolius TaxID=185202 RepID=A0ACB9CES1_9ASTR|nr:hypothetical protein L1987_63990 [Smallanthus sonchifolius]